jgi:CheY-like chemotaxis protein
MLVTVVDDGQKALDMIQTNGSFNLVLINIQMPIINSPTAARKVKAVSLANAPYLL